MKVDKSANETRIIDFGAHFFPLGQPENEEVHDYIAEQEGRRIHDDIDALNERYRSAGVDGAVLSQEDVITSDDLGRVRNENDAMLDLALTHDNIYSLAAVPVAAGGEEAAAELERCIDLGHNGGMIQTNVDGVEIHHTELQPVLEVANRTRAPLLVHPKVHNSLHEDVLDDSWRLNAQFGREVTLCESIVKATNSGILDQYPDLNLVYHHMGGNIASMLGRIRGDLEEGRWPTAHRLQPYEEFRAQLEDRIYVDTSGFYGDLKAFEATFNAFPSSNILFGTDFPYETRNSGDFERILATIQSLRPREEVVNILGQNAVELLANTDSTA